MTGSRCEQCGDAILEPAAARSARSATGDRVARRYRARHEARVRKSWVTEKILSILLGVVVFAQSLGEKSIWPYILGLALVALTVSTIIEVSRGHPPDARNRA